ncbi:FAD:protein FMN transferase [Actinocrispum sp. NPDC049592]|uniref:FAD:protein FMN transferase n=1 Tax=Actinocrispum sp. NPDC049592 TaxID=3154835 RepID=UPI00342F8EFB
MILATGPDTSEWPVWTTTARIVVTEPRALSEAATLVKAMLAEIDRAASRFRPDSELNRVPAGVATQVSPLLAEMVRVSLSAADRTRGAVDPTVGAAMVALGYDRDLAEVLADKGKPRVTVVPGWRSVHLRGTELTVPRGVVLDLGATGKAFAADRCARLISQLCHIGVLVSLGGDIATAGPAPDRGWQVHLEGTDQVISLPAGAAIATSSTESRTWRRDGRVLHHVLDPSTGLPARRIWRSASVVADRCVDANMLSTAALVWGGSAPRKLREFGVPARLTAADGSPRLLGGWP